MELILVIFAYIILIYLALCYPKLLAFSLITSLLVEYLFRKREHFDFPDSKYGNISVSRDIDMTTQEVPGINFKDNSAIDNSDAIDIAITRGTTLFHPNGSGFSPLKGSVDTSESFSEYSIPLSGKQDVDEMLARKQQQRSANNKKSLDRVSISTKEMYAKYFQEELDENENRVWWSSESQEVETDWNPY